MSHIYANEGAQFQINWYVMPLRGNTNIIVLTLKYWQILLQQQFHGSQTNRKVLFAESRTSYSLPKLKKQNYIKKYLKVPCEYYNNDSISPSIIIIRP